jgi:hypothetical protein
MWCGWACIPPDFRPYDASDPTSLVGRSLLEWSPQRVPVRESHLRADSARPTPHGTQQQLRRLPPGLDTAPPLEPGMSITVQCAATASDKALAATIKFQLCRACLYYHFSSHQTMVWKEYCSFSHDSIVVLVSKPPVTDWPPAISSKSWQPLPPILQPISRIKYTEKNF